MKLLFRNLFLVVISTCVLSANASVILSSDFTGINGDASNVNWLQENVLVNSELEPLDSNENGLNLFNVGDFFAVQRNLHTQGSWYIDIDFTVSFLLEKLQLSNLMFDAIAIINQGRLQQVQRDLSFSLNIMDNSGSLFSDTFDVFVGDNNSSGFNPVAPVSFDLSSIELIGGGDYIFRLTAFGEGSGNNAGLDNLALNGTSVFDQSQVNAVPTPESATLLLLSSLLLLTRFKRKS